MLTSHAVFPREKGVTMSDSPTKPNSGTPALPDVRACLELTRPVVNQLTEVLFPNLPAISEEERAMLHRPRRGFSSQAPVLVQALNARPEIAALAKFDGNAVLERLHAVETIDQLAAQLAEIQQRLADGRLALMADALRPSLLAYNISKKMANTDPTLRTVNTPMASVFKSAKKAESSSPG